MLDLDDLLADLRRCLDERSPVLAVKEVVARAVSSPADVVDALGEPDAGGLRVLHRADDLTVLSLTWPPHMSLYPHNHNTWGCIGVYGGREHNTFHRRGPGGKGLVESGGKTLETSDVVVLGDDVIHSVDNPLDRYTGAIHVYGADFFAISRSEWTCAGPDGVEGPYRGERLAATFAEAERAWAEATRSTPGSAQSAADAAL